MKNIIVLFEVTLKDNEMDHYLLMAESLKEELSKADGFISAKRYSSLQEKGKLLSKSVWKDEESIVKWRNLMKHRLCQKQGRIHCFIDYKIMVVTNLRTYTMNRRKEAPKDSNHFFALNEGDEDVL